MTVFTAAQARDDMLVDRPGAMVMAKMTFSPKAGRLGKDLGAPGKNFANPSP
jgi:hypothetical protein